MITEAQKKLIESKAMAVSTVNADGTPNVIPIGFAKVVTENQIVITDNFMRQTAENIQRSPGICLAVWSDDWEEGYKFVGKAAYETSGQWFDLVKMMKENEGMPAKAAVVVTVEQVIELG